MRINFVLPFINPSGGVRIVFEYANRLHRRGHDVVIYFPLVPYRFADRLDTLRGLRRWLGDLRLNLRRRNRLRWFNLQVPLVIVPRISSLFIRPADATIATAWPTAYAVDALPATAGTGFYFVQGYERWSGPAAAVDGSYRLPLSRIVIASWLRRLIERDLGQPVLDVISNGVDTSVFYPDRRAPGPTGRVLVQYSPLELKGIGDFLCAWEIAQREYRSASLVMFGLHRGADVPESAEFHLDPDRAHLRRLYSGCDVFVSPSWTEGCQLPPMEAMACGTAVVATNVGGIPDYAVAGETALVVEPREVQGMAEAIIRLLRDDEERRRIAEAGFRHIQQFTWERAVERFEAALMRGITLSRGGVDSASQRP